MGIGGERSGKEGVVSVTLIQGRVGKRVGVHVGEEGTTIYTPGHANGRGNKQIRDAEESKAGQGVRIDKRKRGTGPKAQGRGGTRGVGEGE